MPVRWSKSRTPEPRRPINGQGIEKVVVEFRGLCQAMDPLSMVSSCRSLSSSGTGCGAFPVLDHLAVRVEPEDVDACPGASPGHLLVAWRRT